MELMGFAVAYSNYPLDFTLWSYYKVRHLIVKDGDRTVGIVTASNFIDYLDEQLDGDDLDARVLRTLKDEI
jgi:hypothetical protein